MSTSDPACPEAKMPMLVSVPLDACAGCADVCCLFIECPVPVCVEVVRSPTVSLPLCQIM